MRDLSIIKYVYYILFALLETSLTQTQKKRILHTMAWIMMCSFEIIQTSDTKTEWKKLNNEMIIKKAVFQ